MCCLSKYWVCLCVWQPGKCCWQWRSCRLWLKSCLWWCLHPNAKICKAGMPNYATSTLWPSLFADCLKMVSSVSCWLECVCVCVFVFATAARSELGVFAFFNFHDCHLHPHMASLHITHTLHTHTYLRVVCVCVLTSLCTWSHVRCYAPHVFLTWSHIPLDGGAGGLTSFMLRSTCLLYMAWHTANIFHAIAPHVSNMFSC